MRNNRRLRGFNEEEETKKIVYISIAVVVLAILTFVITYVVYSNTLNKNSEDLTSKISQMPSEKNETSYEASSYIGKNVNEVQEETEKIAINTTNIEEQKEQNTNIESKTQEIVTNETKKQEVEKVPTFIKPVEGEIIKEFSMENLIYSETLKEWVVHNGIDIKAEKTTIVKSAAEGTIKSIKNDPRYGITVIIEHSSGFVSIYSNLLTAEFVKEGETVKQGQTIGTVGNTASFEIADETHLHFEILKNNEYLNPSEYIK